MPDKISPGPPPLRGWRKLWSSALDVLFPPVCAICSENLTHGESLCCACDADLPRLIEPFCQICGEAFAGQIEGLFTCPNCSKRKFAFEFARPALLLDDHTRSLVHSLKYGRQIHLAKELGRIATESFADPRFAPALAGNWPLVPVPLHVRRYQQRYFNQAEEIARTLSHHTGLPLLNGLCRIRATGHQTALARAGRLKNLRGAFIITSSGRRHVKAASAGAILVDDVLTTGATVEECAKALRRAGFQRVFVVTVMRG